MNRVEDVERQVKSFSQAELRAFRDWFAGYDAEVWDAQIEEDVKNAKLRPLVEKALRDHKAGRSSLL